MDLIIKKGEFDIYSKVSIYEINLIRFFDNISNYSNRSYYSLTVNEINNKKSFLIDIFGENLLNGVFDGFSFESLISKYQILLDLYDKYNIKKYKIDLKEIIIEDDLDLNDLTNIFIKDYILIGEYKIIIKGNLTIRNLNGFTSLKNLNIDKKFNILFIKEKTIEFVDCNFGIEDSEDDESSFNIKNYDGININFKDTFIYKLKISKNELGLLYFYKCFGNLEITDNKSIQSLNIDSSIFTSIIIKDNIFNGRCRISSEPVMGEILYPEIGSINFINNSICDLRIGHLKTNILNIDNLKIKTDYEINIGDIIVKKFTISNIRNLGKIRFYDINYGLKVKSKNIININNSSFGNSEFQNLNIKSFNDVILYDNLFSDLKYTGVDWIYTIKVDKPSNYGKLRNIYRILKEVAERNSDNITALKFYANEMESHRKYLLKKGWKNNFIDLFIIYFNKLSSNYGLNFILPFLTIFFINFILMFIIFALVFDFNLENHFSISNLTKNFSFILGGLNITNSLNDIFGIRIENGLISSIFLIKNILISALLYQLILSFRKFTRKT